MTSDKNTFEPTSEQDGREVANNRAQSDSSKSIEEQIQPFPIASIGASVNGLHAFEEFFGNLPEQPGMAFVIVHHMDTGRQRDLLQLLQNCTDMEVHVVEEERQAAPDQIYVIPSGRTAALRNGTLHLSELDADGGVPNLVDNFLRSLAEDQKENAICVILSGAGDDGCIGLKRVKELGGLVMVQEPADAEQDELPLNALGTGLVDVVAPAAELASRLLSYQAYTDLELLDTADEPLDSDQDEVLRQIFGELRSQTGRDFNHYKRTTIQRRLSRRMRVNQIRDIHAYLRFLQGNEEEAKALVKDFLISVTRFFRDAGAFEVLEQDVIPRLLQNREAGEMVRIWVPGCATGEEAYSLAILFAEAIEREGKDFNVQIFATDIDEAALAVARRGLYPVNIAADVSRSRLERFFTREMLGYRAQKEIQQFVLFAHHDLLKDPPFSRLDLISCRNLLIYLNRDVQKRIFEICHYALRPMGHLFLGTAETADRLQDLFIVVDKESRIYQRRPGPQVLPRLPSALATPLGKGSITPTSTIEDAPTSNLRNVHHTLLLYHYTPPSVIIDRNYEVQHLSGNMGHYLQPPQGKPTYNLLQMLPDSLKLELRSILFQVFRKEQRAVSHPLLFNRDGETRRVRLYAEPVPRQQVEDELALVVFEELQESERITPHVEDSEAQHAIIEQLEDDLKETRHRLQTIIEEYETSNEELKASNEELQSTNEELHSTTEELQTREEELQSANRELNAVNHELRNRIEELHQVNSDVENLIEATAIATIFVDRNLRLKRYTPRATELFHLIPSDIGRPFDHIAHEFKDIVLSQLAAQVLKRLEPIATEVRSRAGRWFQLRILPYRTVDNRIDGVVLTFVDITRNLEAEKAARTRARQQAVVAELGQIALKGANVDEIMDVAVRQVAQVLDVELCKVLELQPDGKELLLKAGIGWKEGYVRKATVSAGIDSQAGYTLEVGGPVIVDDLATEKRFDDLSLLLEHDVVSGMSVVIQGRERPYGVMGAHTKKQRAFTEQDAAFLQAVANVLGTAVARQAAERERTALLARVEAERAHLHTLFMQAPAFIAMREGPEHVYTFANTLHRQVLNQRDIIGKPVRDVLPELEGQSFLEDLDAVFNTGQPIVRREQEIRFDRDGDGELEIGYFDVGLQPIRREDGSIEGVMSFAFEVTNEVQARQELEAERARLKAVLEQLPVGVVIAEVPSGRLILDNERAAEIWRHPPLMVMDLSKYQAYQTFYPDGTPYAPESWPIRRAMAHGETVHNEEIHILRGDNSRGVISASAAPIRNRSGEVVAAVVVLQDITERKENEAAREELVRELENERSRLKQLTETLEERVNERTTQVRSLASALSLAEQRERERISQILHDDLQQLLHALHVQLLMLHSSQEMAEMAALQAQLGEIEALVGRALDVTRALTVEMSPPILKGEGLDAALNWLASHVEDVYGLHVNLTIDEQPGVIGKDLRELVFQLVRELLFNIVKHAGVDEAAITVFEREGHLAIRVQDDGAGFDVNEVLAQQDHGGFGLHSIQRRLDLFGGEMEIESKPDNGTVVTIIMPKNLGQV